MNSSNVFLSGLQSILKTVSDVLLYPVLILLIVGIIFAIFDIGSILVEYFRERRYFKDTVPELLRDITETPLEDMPAAIQGSGLLKPQKELLLTMLENKDLPEESRWALAKKLLTKEKTRSNRKAMFDEIIGKIAPMLGLMGTLIPLGPALVAFGEGDPTVMSNAMLVAFNTTIAGLVVAVVMFLISKIRRKWYVQYFASVEAGVTSLLERMDTMDKEPAVVIESDDVQELA